MKQKKLYLSFTYIYFIDKIIVVIEMKTLFISPVSISVELENFDIYYCESYKVYLNGEYLYEGNTNVLSIYDLIPNTKYKLEVISNNFIEEQCFETQDKKLKLIKSEGFNDMTEVVQNAIDNLNEDEVLVLDGKFKIVSLFIRKGIDLYLKKGTILLGETDRNKFPILKHDEFLNGIPLGTWEGDFDDSFASIITILGAKNVSIYGEGIIDCNAQNSDWWINHRVKRIARRPKGIFIHTSEDVTFDGIRVCNTPSWNQHPFYSKNINYYNCELINPFNSPTTDGIDPESCENVNIIGCKISVGDDCIAIKSGKINFARLYHKPSSMITIRNCLMNNGHAGVTIGSENSGGINNVLVTKCLFEHTDRGIRIKSQRGRGKDSIIENITFHNIKMDNVMSPFVINAFYKAGNDVIDDRFKRDYLPVNDLTPRLKSFEFSNISCLNVSLGLAHFLGLPEAMIESVTLNDIMVTYNKDAKPMDMDMKAWVEEFKNVGIYAENVKRIVLKNVKFLDEPTKKFILRNVNFVEEN